MRDINVVFIGKYQFDVREKPNILRSFLSGTSTEPTQPIASIVFNISPFFRWKTSDWEKSGKKGTYRYQQILF